MKGAHTKINPTVETVPEKIERALKSIQDGLGTLQFLTSRDDDAFDQIARMWGKSQQLAKDIRKRSQGVML